MNKIARYLLAALFHLLLLPPIKAQESTGTMSFIFRFIPGKEVFNPRWSTNAEEMARLVEVLTDNIDALENGWRYISVTSYSASASEGTTPRSMAYMRCLRIKSQLITRAGVNDKMFVEDQYYDSLYYGTIGDVVVVTFPATVERVAQTTGKEAVAHVEAYNRQLYAKATRMAEAKAEQGRHEAYTLAALANKQSHYTFAVRANLLRWATLTPDIGFEWRITQSIGVMANISYTSWTWSNNNRRYALWETAPQLRYYMGKKSRGYLGAMYKMGTFNIKLSDTGRQGDIMGGGLTGGYQIRFNKSLSMDFGLCLGYFYIDSQTYEYTDGIRFHTGYETINRWGPLDANVTLVWMLF